MFCRKLQASKERKFQLGEFKMWWRRKEIPNIEYPVKKEKQEKAGKKNVISVFLDAIDGVRKNLYTKDKETFKIVINGISYVVSCENDGAYSLLKYGNKKIRIIDKTEGLNKIIQEIIRDGEEQERKEGKEDLKSKITR